MARQGRCFLADGTHRAVAAWGRGEQTIEVSAAPVVPARLVDVLDTGEQQPRLPGAEQVRDQEQATPTFAAPFSLTSEVARGSSDKQTMLFQGAPSIESELQQEVAIPAQVSDSRLDAHISERDPETLRRRAFAFVKARATHLTTNAHTGWRVSVSKDGLKKSANYAVRAGQLVGLLNVDRLVESAVFLRSATDRDSRTSGVRYDYLYAPFTFGDDRFVAKITLKKGQRGAGDRTFYALHVQQLDERPADRNADYTSAGTRDSSGSGGSTLSKSELFRFVNEARQVTPLFQSKRGAIRFGPDRQFTIALFEKADLSTFLHESGHLYLEVLGDLSDELSVGDPMQLSGTQKQILADAGTIMQWLGVENRSAIGRAQHEEYARAFERHDGRRSAHARGESQAETRPRFTRCHDGNALIVCQLQ